MLTNRFDILMDDYQVAEAQLRQLDADETISKKGRIYQDRRALIMDKMRGILFKLKSLGGGIPVVTINAFLVKDSIVNSLAIQFAGITSEDAMSIVKLRYPTSYGHKVKTKHTGKASIQPVINNSEFKEN